MSKFMFCIFSFILIFHNVYSANILGLFPHTVKSHHMVFEPFLRRLTERGHNLTLASFFPFNKDPSPDVNFISFQGIYETRLESVDLNDFENENILYRVPLLGSVAKQILPLHVYAAATTKICERLIAFPPLTDALKGDYDLVIMQNFMGNCMVGLLHVYGIKAPILGVVSGARMPWTMDHVGAVDNPAYVPVITSSFTSKMSFTERLENTLVSIGIREWHKRILMKERKILEKKFGNIPDLNELGKNMSMIFLNSFYVLNGASPLVPGLVEVGGMHLIPTKKFMPHYIERFLNESSHGVVVFSFGSHIKTMSLPKYKEEIFINALSKLKQRVIWKYEGSGEEGTLIGNILRVKWLPQYELLQHKKVIAFISHGGMLGMTEAVSEGKPMVVIPFFADQFLNAAAAAEAGVARVVSYKDLTEEALTSALDAVLGDEMVAKAQQVSQMWHDRETTPLDTAIFYTERTIRWGHNAKMYSKGRDLPFYQLALLDVALAILVALVVFFVIIAYIIMKLLRLLMRESKVKVH